MTYNAKILADSISPDGVRLTTFEVTFPRIVLAEFNTHRMFSRNSASSRAIPVKKMIERVMETPYIPSSWGKNQKGMQAEEEVSDVLVGKARDHWFRARDRAVEQAQDLFDLGIHKQLTNRLLEPFMWHTCIVTATEWDNFFHLRNNKDAHPDIQIPARMMQELYESQEPERLDYGEWHLPLVSKEELFEACSGPDDIGFILLRSISAARCARVSYLTHEGKRDPEKDIELHDRLLKSGHMSPFEHVARPARGEIDLSIGLAQWVAHDCSLGGDRPRPQNTFFGNFRGWVQYRKLISNEEDILQ